MTGYIITGTSRGLGKALAELLMHPGKALACISRTLNPDLVQKAKREGVPLTYFPCDLADPENIEPLMTRIMAFLGEYSLEEIVLINNAGVLKPIQPMDRIEIPGIISHMNVNIISPAVLCAAFIQRTEKLGISRQIINVSSGAGSKPLSGWTPYSASKAAINMLSRSIALEQNGKANPVKVYAFVPGIVDTDMQGTIRTSTHEDFPDLDRFIAFKKDGKLLSPEFVAGKMISLLHDSRFENGSVVDIREMDL